MMSADFVYECDKCPRTFKLEEFYEKHKKVHELKKQHKCDICGFVYGAAKGLEQHLKTHLAQQAASQPNPATAAAAAAAAAAAVAAINMPGAPARHPFDIPNVGFLSRQGVLASAPIPEKELVPEISKVVAPMLPTEPIKPPPNLLNSTPTPPPAAAVLPPVLPPVNALGGTGEYKVYDSLPEVGEFNCTASGFYSCSVCNRDFSGLNSLRKHLPLHARKVQHACSTCGHVFGKRDYLLEHIKAKHGQRGQQQQQAALACNICRVTCSTNAQLADHRKLHSNLKPDGSVHIVMPYRCHICKEIFQLGPVLSSHLSTMHPNSKNGMVNTPSSEDSNKTNFCPACNQSFKRQAQLRQHLLQVHAEFVQNNPDVFSKMGLESPAQGQHYFDAVKGTQMLACTAMPACEQRFLRKTDLLIHLENEHGQKGAPCTLCGEKFLQISELRLHITEAHGDDKDSSGHHEPPTVTIRPLGAKKNSDVKPGLKRRRPGPASKTNAPPENRVQLAAVDPAMEPSLLYDPVRQGFTCPHCGKTLQHRQSLVTHIRLTHTNYYSGPKWKGSQVVEMILEESNKLSPKKSKSGPDANAQLCSVCEQVFPNPSSLRNHVVNVHIQGQNWTCDLCGKAFLSQDNLNAHIKAKHPSMNKRLQALRKALGLNVTLTPTNNSSSINSSGEPEMKRARLNLIHGIKLLPTPDVNANSCVLPSDPVLSKLSSLSPHPLDLSISSKHGLDSEPEVLANQDMPPTSQASSCQSLSSPSSRPLSPNKIPPVIVNFPNLLSFTNNSNTTLVTSASLNNNNNNNSPDTMTATSGGSNNSATSPTPSGRKKNSICRICGVVLSPKTNVNVHMRTHSGARPYQCVLCLNRFRQKAHLMKHFRCSHNQKRPPFVCLFCPKELAGSNDLYRHITDVHQAETDDYVRTHGITAPAEEPETNNAQSNIIEPMNTEVAEAEPEADQPPAGSSDASDEDDVRYEAITEAFLFENQIIYPCYVILPFVSDQEVEQMTNRTVKAYYDLESDSPSDGIVAGAVQDEDEEEEAGQLTIDESQNMEANSEHGSDEKEELHPANLGALLQKPIDPEILRIHNLSSSKVNSNEAPAAAAVAALALAPATSATQALAPVSAPLPPTVFSGSCSKLETLTQVAASALSPLLPNSLHPACAAPEDPNKESVYNAEDVAMPQRSATGFYPNFGDYSLPFSLSSLWKKKADVLPPETVHQLEMIQKRNEIKELNAPVSEKIKSKPAPKQQQNSATTTPVAPKPKHYPTNSGNRKQVENASPGQSTIVSEYENQVQNDMWPVKCIKCSISLDNLDNFNIHMNEHWSDDKCCPVCGLLINSKRFNFKQHLKIHTGEKPFECKICKRTFRQKAHMVKHITTHRDGGSAPVSVH